MRHAILVALTLALGPVATDGFRAWPASSPSVTVAQSESGSLVLGGAPPPYRLEPLGAGYAILPGDAVTTGPAPCWEHPLGRGPGYELAPGGVSAVSTTAIWFEPFK